MSICTAEVTQLKLLKQSTAP